MIVKLILVGLALFGLYVWLGAFWRRRFAFEPGYEEIHLARTGDACRIALYRYPANRKRHETPVLLCHGLAANRFNFDLGPEVSLARYLQHEGFDVWSIDLRGRGGSGNHTKGSANNGAHVFDDYVRQDAVAAIRHVRGETAASQVHWIGHSMGGLVLYGVLQGEEAESIASGVTIASPGTFAHMRRIPLVYFLFHGLRYLPRIHLRFLAAGLAPLLSRIRLPWEGIFLNRDNAEVTPMDRALCYLVSDISRGEIRQFLDWMKNKEFRAYNKTHSYEANLARIQQPLFLIAGARDLLVPPRSVAEVFDRISSERKAFLILGREQGHQEDYGHGDLLMGKNSRREVFPRILQWLESVEAGQSPS
jgi:pimeloyl-ACP methyl ester carboxylesterase